MSVSRRRFLGVVGAVGSVGLAGCNTEQLGGEPTPAPVSTPWPMHRHDPQKTGVTDATGPTAPVTEQWRVQPTGKNGDIPAVWAMSPAVAGTTVYVGGRDHTIDGAPVYALSIADGSTQWRYALGESETEVNAPPAVVDDTVYAVSFQNYVVALAVAEETARGSVGLIDDFPWGRVRARNDYWSHQGPLLATRSPVVADGTVYITTRGTVATGPSVILALDAADGTEQWHVSDDDTHEYTGVAVADDTVYVGGHRDRHNEPVQNNRVQALATSDGTEQWRYEFDDGRMPGYVAVANDTVYPTTTNGTLYALAAADGTEQWTFHAATAPAVTGDTVYVGGWRDIVAVDAADGTERWRHAITSPRAPVVAGDTVYVGNHDHIAALDAADGTERWTVQKGYAEESSLAVADRAIYAIDGNSVYAITEA